MFISLRRNLRSAGFVGFHTQNSPFGSSENIFAAPRQQQSQQQGRQVPPSGAYTPPNQVPSAAVPGTTVSGLPEGESQLHSKNAQEGASPLDKYKSLADNKNKQQPAGDGAKGEKPAAAKSILDASHEDFSKVMESQQLVKELDPELYKQALSGDQRAFEKILADATRSAASTAVYMATQVTKQGINSNLENFRGEIPGMFKEQQFGNMFNDKKDIFSNPVLKPMVSSAQSMFRQQYPDATPQEIEEYTREYLKDAALAMSGSGEQSPEQKQQEEQGSNLAQFFKFD